MNQFTKLREVKAIYKKSDVTFDKFEQIRSCKDAYSTIKQLFDIDTLEHVESCYVLLLNRNHKPIGWSLISIGGTSGTVVDPKIVFQRALISNASALIIAHNHPSGNTAPSKEDIVLTEKLINGGKLLDIDVLDHLIVTADDYTSIIEMGVL